MRRTTSTPRSAPPLQRPATTHSVPPPATCSSAQRSRNAPPPLPAHPPPTVRKRMGGAIPGGGRLSSLHQLYGRRATAGREPHLAEPLEQSHVELGLLLIAVEPQLHQHLALGRGHVARRQPVERVHEHVAAARLAAAEPGQLGTELAVLPLHHLERQVRHPTTASSPVWSTG